MRKQPDCSVVCEEQRSSCIFTVASNCVMYNLGCRAVAGVISLWLRVFVSVFAAFAPWHASLSHAARTENMRLSFGELLNAPGVSVQDSSTSKQAWQKSPCGQFSQWARSLKHLLQTISWQSPPHLHVLCCTGESPPSFYWQHCPLTAVNQIHISFWAVCQRISTRQ